MCCTTVYHQYSCKPQEKDWKRIPRTCNSNVKKETLQQEYVAGSPHTGRAVIMSSDLMISALLECSGHLRTSTVNFNRQKASECVKSHSTLIHSKLKLPSSCRQEFFCQWSTMLDCSFSSKKDIGYLVLEAPTSVSARGKLAISSTQTPWSSWQWHH